MPACPHLHPPPSTFITTTATAGQGGARAHAGVRRRLHLPPRHPARLLHRAAAGAVSSAVLRSGSSPGRGIVIALLPPTCLPLHCFLGWPCVQHSACRAPPGAPPHRLDPRLRVGVPPQGVSSRAYIEGGTHNANFDGLVFYPKWSLPGWVGWWAGGREDGRDRAGRGDAGCGSISHSCAAPWVRPLAAEMRRSCCPPPHPPPVPPPPVPHPPVPPPPPCTAPVPRRYAAIFKHAKDELGFCYYLIPCGAARAQGQMGSVKVSARSGRRSPVAALASLAAWLELWPQSVDGQPHVPARPPEYHAVHPPRL